MRSDIPSIDRTKSPPIRPVTEITWENPEILTSENGLPLYIFRDRDIDAVRLHLTFTGGMVTEQKRLVAAATASNLKEGTSSMNSSQIAASFDFWGSFLKTQISRDSSDVSLFFLNRYAKENLNLLLSVICSPSFPDSELNLYLNNQKEEWLRRNQRVDYLARMLLLSHLYGPDHPYGRFPEKDDFNKVHPGDLRTYHNRNYHAGNLICLAAGNLTNKVVKEILHFMNTLPPAPEQGDHKKLPNPANKPVEVHREVPEALQSAIHIGKRLFNRNHPDYIPFQVLNTILGGYFGSRLMQNLREEKGLTYGIYSSLVSLKHDGVFSISAEVNAGATQTAIGEILKEILQLREKEVSEEELSLVRNYFLGTLLQGFDGVMNRSEVTRSLLLTETPFDYFNRLNNTVRNITPAKLRDLAVQYLDPESLTVATAGKK